MAITLGELRQTAARIVGSKPDDSFDIEAMINDAGRYLFNMHSWNWRNRPVAPLSYLAPISISDATYTESTKTITKTSGFTNYTFRNAELFNVSAGTNATTGEYPVAGRTSANAITLNTSIGSTADGQTDIDGTIKFPYCVLPSDFGEGQIIDLTHRQNTVYGIYPATLEQVRWLRYNSLVNAYQIYYALSYPSQTSTSAVPANPLLEIYPTPTAADNAVLMLTYKSGWVVLEDEDAVANLPLGYEYLLKRIVKGFAHEAMSHDASKILEVETSIEFLKAKRMDGNSQWNLGQLMGGAAKARPNPSYMWNFTTTDPS